jgi:hypothetical protein
MTGEATFETAQLECNLLKQGKLLAHRYMVDQRLFQARYEPTDSR